MKKCKFLAVLIIIALVMPQGSYSQGFGIPSKKWGLGFGNTKKFTGIRINSVDKNVESIVGVNITSWIAKDIDEQTGSFYGVGFGLPMAMGTENRYGASVAILGVGAAEDVFGINIGGVAVGGNNVKGINLGGIAVGAGEDLFGFNIGGLAVGSGHNVSGINLGGLAVGAGNNVSGLNLSVMAVGSGNNVSGITLGGLAAGAGKHMTGLNIGGLALGAGEKLMGINIAGLAMGAGEKVIGLNASVLAVGSGDVLGGITLAGVAAGAPNVKGLTVAPVVGGQHVSGIILAPAYMRVISGTDDEEDATMTGLSISAFNHIQGVQKGITIGIFNYAYKVKGVQFGLLNYNKSNPRGLRLLPVFNTRLGKR